MYTNIAPRDDVYHSVRPTRLPPKKKGQRWTESEDENLRTHQNKKGQRWTESEDENLRNGEEKFRDVGKNDQKWRRAPEELFGGQWNPEICRQRFMKLQKRQTNIHLHHDKDKDSEQKEIEEQYFTITELQGNIAQLERTNEELRHERSKDEGFRKRNWVDKDETFRVTRDKVKRQRIMDVSAKLDGIATWAAGIAFENHASLTKGYVS
jgi:hypothetical protein